MQPLQHSGSLTGRSCGGISPGEAQRSPQECSAQGQAPCVSFLPTRPDFLKGKDSHFTLFPTSTGPGTWHLGATQVVTE